VGDPDGDRRGHRGGLAAAERAGAAAARDGGPADRADERQQREDARQPQLAKRLQVERVGVADLLVDAAIVGEAHLERARPVAAQRVRLEPVDRDPVEVRARAARGGQPLGPARRERGRAHELVPLAVDPTVRPVELRLRAPLGLRRERDVARERRQRHGARRPRRHPPRRAAEPVGQVQRREQTLDAPGRDRSAEQVRRERAAVRRLADG
jgi:hypothetical protein